MVVRVTCRDRGLDLFMVVPVTCREGQQVHIRTMDDDFSGSLTPPISPYISQPVETDIGCMRPPCFTCTTDIRDAEKPFSIDSYLASGSLKRLFLRLDPSPVDYESETVELFGFQWVTETALVESTRLLFGFLRQLIHKLESMVKASSSFDFGHAANKHMEAEDIRKQCTAFLQYVKVFVYRYLEPPRMVRDEQSVHPYEELEAQLPSTIVQELHTLTLYLGHLSELPSNILNALTTETQGKILPPAWHLLHLYLDVHWSILEILHLLGDKMTGQIVYAHQFMNLTGENITNVSLFESHCTNLIWDLINLAIQKYGKVRPSEALTSSPFHCTCIKELWVLLIQILDQRNRMSYTELFWSWISKLLKFVVVSSTETDGIQLCNISHCKEPLGFSWWIITHIAMLYKFGRNGTIEEEKEIESNWSFVEDLVKQSCDSKSVILEEQLRMHVHCCLALSDLWNSNLTTVTQLWEYYSKHLNSSFNIPWLGLKGLMAIRKTPFSMLELVKNCCSNEQYLDLYNTGTSFQIFLHILALQIKKAKGTHGAHPWKQIKGRVYSKFHQRKMQELTETGLQNFLNLFLVLADVAEIEDVVSRVSELLNLLSPSAISPDQKSLIWRGYFAFLLMYVEKNLDIGVLAENLSKEFQEIAKEFLVTKNDLSRKVTLWKLLSVYIDGVQEVFETSCYLHLSEEKLLNDGFSLLLPACRESELNFVLSFLQTVLARLRNVHKRSTISPFQGHNITVQTSPSLFLTKERHLAIASALWKNFFVHLKRLRLAQTPPPPQLADTAAGFTLLALDVPSTASLDLQPQPVLSMLQLFGWDDMVHPALVSRFLSHLIQHSPLVEAVSTVGSTSYQACCVRSWLRCVLQMHISQTTGSSENADVGRMSAGRVNTEQLVELTRLIFKFPEVEQILLKAQHDTASLKQDPKGALFQFLKTFGMAFSGLQTLADKSSTISRGLEYIGDIVKYVKPYMVNKGPAEGLQLAYRTVGCIMKYWAPILATSKAQPLLLRIIDCLLLPNFVYQQDKELHPAMLSAMRESLPLYLQGLSVISSMSHTQSFYLKQQLQKVILQYFIRFLPAAPSGSGVVNHPVLTAVCEPASAASQLRKTVLQVIKDNCLQFKGHAPPPRLASVLAFLFEVLRKSNSTDVATDAMFLLPAVLKCIVLVNESQVKKISTDILQYSIESCPSTAEEPHTQLASVLSLFIQEYMGTYSQQVFNVLEMVMVLSQPLVVSLIPAVTKSLKESEHKQGLGRNSAKRDAYKRLLSHLGEKGQQEILELNDDSC
ncbi:protein MMS22-like [Protopterus annectens]|uniref:protein MMS22-like n=1 Tax=Protopterus annectens TaxID=7888 RepID=UPI001CFA02A3|nr:protein MMS22-like [Protopterus annectens]